MNNKVKFLRGTSGEYAVAEKDSDTIYFTTDDGKLYIGDKEISGSDITIDDILSDTSTNPVQNKVVKQAIDNKADKTVATTSADGLMSAEDKSKLDSADDTYALKSKYGDSTIDVGRKAGTTIGSCSTAEGHNTTASGDNSHAEGHNTTASGDASHAEGIGTTASGNYSHAGGGYTKALHMNEVAYGQYNESNDDTLFSIGDGTSDSARHNAFEITTTGGKLHDKDIATTDLIPTTLPANGGNADTVDGYHVDNLIHAPESTPPKYSTEFLRINDDTKSIERWSTNNLRVAFANNAGDANTVGGKVSKKIFYDNGFSADLNGATQSGCYAASPNTLNAPSSSRWLVDTMNFNNQFIVQKAHTIGGTTTVSYIRNYANDVWAEWQEISTTPIKSTTLSGTTDPNGNLMLWAASENKIPICAILTGYCSTIFHYAPNGHYYLGVSDFATREYSPNVSVGGTVYYIEQG